MSIAVEAKQGVVEEEEACLFIQHYGECLKRYFYGTSKEVLAYCKERGLKCAPGDPGEVTLDQLEAAFVFVDVAKERHTKKGPEVKTKALSVELMTAALAAKSAEVEYYKALWEKERSKKVDASRETMEQIQEEERKRVDDWNRLYHLVKGRTE